LQLLKYLMQINHISEMSDSKCIKTWQSMYFELCRLPQRPSLTLHPLGGSTPRMWPLFLLRAKGKRKEMTGTKHVGTLKHKFLQYIIIKNVLVLFHYQNNFEISFSSAFWWRHLPVACNNFFEAGVSGNEGHLYCIPCFLFDVSSFIYFKQQLL
jgi:hypothetical protein